MEKEYVVVLNRGVDVEQFHQEMKAETGSGVIPDRAVLVANERPLSQRQFHYMLTQEEVDWLRKDERVYAVQILNNPYLYDEVQAVRNYNFEKVENVSTLNANWGLARSNKRDNPFDGIGRLSDQDNVYNYVLDGTGVDIVIMDTGVLVDHPEFQDAQGNSRVKQIDWPSSAGALYLTQPSNFYEDTYGHGTHVAGTAAGKTYGWAPGANIYSMAINISGVTNGFSVLDGFDLIKGWHLNKTNGRPTIVNMSWGTTLLLRAADWRLFALIHRNVEYYWNTDYTRRSAIYEDLGLLDPTPFITEENGITSNDIYGPFRNDLYDAALQELNDAGILTITSAGNLPLKHDLATGVDYDNTFFARYIGVSNENYINGNLYNGQYHRGSSPYDEKTLNVANLSNTLESSSQKELINTNSTRGPAISVIAPGTKIISAWGSNTSFEDTRPDQVLAYPFDSNYKIVMSTGTSMAAPQVTGIAALYWQLDPKMTNDELVNRIKLDATKNVVYNTVLDNNYANNATLLGTPNRLLYNRYGSSSPGSFENLGSTNFE